MAAPTAPGERAGHTGMLLDESVVDQAKRGDAERVDGNREHLGVEDTGARQPLQQHKGDQREQGCGHDQYSEGVREHALAVVGLRVATVAEHSQQGRSQDRSAHER